MSDAVPFDNSSRRPADADLSAEIEQSIERQFGERVTCRRISGSNYRCNWWSPRSSPKYDNPRMESPFVTTHVVVRSRFLTVRRTEQGLLIDDASMSASGGS
jgi:hypothetical protein